MHNEEVLLTAFRHLDSLSSSGSAGDRGASGEKAEGGQERAGDEMVSLEEIKAYLRINQLAMSTPAAGSTPGAGAGAAQTTESSHDVDADRRGTSDPDHRGFDCVYSHKRPSALASLPSGTGDRADPIETLLDQNQDGIVSACKYWASTMHAWHVDLIYSRWTSAENIRTSLIMYDSLHQRPPSVLRVSCSSHVLCSGERQSMG